MKIQELFKEEYIGKHVKDNSEEKNEWIIGQTTLLKVMSAERNIKNYYNLKQILELDFEFVEEKTGWKRVKEGDCYFRIDLNNLTIYITEKNGMYDNSAYNSINYFSTKEKAEEVADFQLELRKALKYLDTQLEKTRAEQLKKEFKQYLKAMAKLEY